MTNKPYKIGANYKIIPKGDRENIHVTKTKGLTKTYIKSVPIIKSKGVFWCQIVEL